MGYVRVCRFNELAEIQRLTFGNLFAIMHKDYSICHELLTYLPTYFFKGVKNWKNLKRNKILIEIKGLNHKHKSVSFT